MRTGSSWASSSPWRALSTNQRRKRSSVASPRCSEHAVGVPGRLPREGLPVEQARHHDHAARRSRRSARCRTRAGRRAGRAGGGAAGMGRVPRVPELVPRRELRARHLVAVVGLRGQEAPVVEGSTSSPGRRPARASSPPGPRDRDVAHDGDDRQPLAGAVAAADEQVGAVHDGTGIARGAGRPGCRPLPGGVDAAAELAGWEADRHLPRPPRRRGPRRWRTGAGRRRRPRARVVVAQVARLGPEVVGRRPRRRGGGRRRAGERVHAHGAVPEPRPGGSPAGSPCGGPRPPRRDRPTDHRCRRLEGVDDLVEVVAQEPLGVHPHGEAVGDGHG